MEDAARGLAGRPGRVGGWTGHVGVLGGHTSSTGGWRTPPGSPRKGWQRLGSGGNGGGGPAPAIASATSRPIPTASRSIPRRRTIRQALADELGLRPLLAHCHFGLGALYRRAGKREQAQEHLTTAATMFSEMDMRHWREQAEMAKAALA